MNEHILSVENWETPASRYPAAVSGHCEIRHRMQPAGTYPMYGISGYDYYTAATAFPVTDLFINGVSVVDDAPPMIYGMDIFSELSSGPTVVLGLGLGLIIHALAKNTDVPRMLVIEKELDVVKLVGPYLPKENITGLIVDFWDWNDDLSGYDTLIMDHWVNTPSEVLNALLPASIRKVRKQSFVGRLMVWGPVDPVLNPAVKHFP